MKPEDIHPFDWLRIFLGEVPWTFLLEAALRILFIYVLLLVAMRLMGKRMRAQLSRNERAAMVSLAAATGVPMQAPDRGLLPPLVIAIVIIGVQRAIAYGAFRSKRFERISQGELGLLVADGCIQCETMKKATLSQERLFAQLRSAGIEHLGQVQRVYMEPNGAFTIIQQPESQPGLTLIPSWDQEMLGEQKQVEDTFACRACGNLAQAATPPAAPCQRCGHDAWTPAVTSE